MKKYNRIMLGKEGVYADQCKQEGFIGADFGIEQDLSANLFDDWRTFNKQYIPIYLANHPDKKKVAAGLACGNLWTICKGLEMGDIVLSPNGRGDIHSDGIPAQHHCLCLSVWRHRDTENKSNRTLPSLRLDRCLRG